MCISRNSHFPHRSETVKMGWMSLYSVCRPDTVDSPAHSGQVVVQGALMNSYEVQLNREDSRQVGPGGDGGEKEWAGIFRSVSESSF